MTAVGYDPVRIGQLRRLLDDALTELDELDTRADVEADEVVRWARRVLRDDVLPAVVRVARCTALDRGWTWQGPGGWTVTAARPPAPGAAPPIGSFGAWALDIEQRWRQAAREVAAGRTSAAARMADLRAEVGRVSRAFGSRPDEATLAELADTVPPLLLAMLLDGLELTDDVLARWVIEAQRREYALLASGGGSYGEWGVANTADVVAATLAHRPGAAALWARVAVTEQGLLFYAADPRLEQRALLAATSPARDDALAAGATLQALLVRLHEHGGVIERGATDAPSWRTFLGEAMAPWFTEFTTDLGRWRWSAAAPDRGDALRWVLADPRAEQHLDARARGELFALVGSPVVVDGVVAHRRISTFAASAAEFGAARRDAAVSRASRRRSDGDLLVGAVTTGLAQLTGPAGAAVSGAVSTAFSTPGRRWLSERGWYPADPDAVERAERERWGEAWVDTELVVVRVVAGELADAGRLPDGFVEGLPAPRRGCRPGETDEVLREYVLGFQGTHPDAVADLLATIGAFSNPVSTTGLCDD